MDVESGHQNHSGQLTSCTSPQTEKQFSWFAFTMSVFQNTQVKSRYIQQDSQDHHLRR